MAINASAHIHYNYDDQVLEILPEIGSDSGICIPIDEIVKHGFPLTGGKYENAEEVEKHLEQIVENYKKD